MELIPLFKVFMPESVMEPLRETLLSGYIGEGQKVVEFERLLRPWVEGANVLTVNSCTSAIQLALRLSGVGPGDEVISTPMTCTATNMPILAAGAKIVWADIDPWTGNIDAMDVYRKITSKTKAIVCVHWGGYPCDLEELQAAANCCGAKLIEDAAHAFGASYKGRMIGSHSDFVCFSFQAIKHLTTVDGGALVCRSRDDYEKGKLLRWYGIDRNQKCQDMRCEADIADWGYKFHMNDVAATIGIEQLKYVSENLTRAKNNARKYVNSIGSLSYRPDRVSAFWLYTMRVPNRDDFVKHMLSAGIMASKVHARNDLHTCFRDFKVHLPCVDGFDSEQVSIPVGWWLTEDNVDYIINSVKNFQEVKNDCCCGK